MESVLILTNASDGTSHRVEVELRRRGVHVVYFDTADFPLRCTITAYPGTDDQLILERDWAPSGYLDKARSVWYRRPGQFVVNPLLRPHEQAFAQTEAAAAIGGLFRNLRCLWVNHPSANLEAAFKVLQLQRAAEHGFVVPRSIVTSSPLHAHDFIREAGRDVIIKALDDPNVPYLKEDPTEPGIIYTSRLAQDDLDQLARVKHTACLLQELIPKAVDLRVTVVGRRIFATAIDSQVDPVSSLDWRQAAPRLTFSAAHLPDEIEARIHTLMVSLHLEFAAIDLALTPDGEYVFFEVNPNGEWEWIEDATGQPISSALADLLSGRA